MPKINSGGVPSYDGADAEVGTVTNAVGEQFDLNPQPADEPEPDNQTPAFEPKKKVPAKKAAPKK